ncbi:MAG: HAMP domain-containing sensor histidine kinase [Lachnospiraceae bacterium]|nr:HAMP domain-containing sensor histidine kinase [Lachnospiraceae bacterium]
MDERETWSRGRMLGSFLAKKFIQVMLFIFVCEQIVTMIYRYLLVPLLTNVMMVKDIQAGGEALTSSLRLLITPLWRILADSVPFFIAKPLGNYIEYHPAASIHAPDFIQQYGLTMVKLYDMTILVLLLLQLILAILPYVAAGWWYIHCISVKMRELREEDARVKAEFDRRRNLLFSDITHDIKTPITSIVGYSKAMTDGLVADPEKQQDYLRTIYSKSLRISELITMLFEFVKLDSDGFQLHKEPLDLAELVRENVIILLEDFDEKNIDLDIDIPEEVCMVQADRIQMSRVVTNLLTNAIRYISTGHMVLVKMEIRKKQETTEYVIYVADDGLPIEEEFAKTIFSPFSRSDAARQTTSGGSGLGLSIAHKVAELHDGELTLDLQYGQGYEKAFVLKVPAWEENVDEA